MTPIERLGVAITDAIGATFTWTQEMRDAWDAAKDAEELQLKEREECAKVCDAFANDGGPSGPYECAAAIRARSNVQGDRLRAATEGKQGDEP